MNTIPSLTLCVDARLEHGRFAITTLAGQPVWFGRFFANDGQISNQATAEKAAAMKAVWLAGKVREAVGASQVHLRLLTDAKWLTMPLGQAAELHADAKRRGLIFRPFWIAGKTNPADQLTTGHGYQSADIALTAGLLDGTTLDHIAAEDAQEAEQMEASCHADKRGPSGFEKTGIKAAQSAEQAARFSAAGITPQQENEWIKTHAQEWADLKIAMKGQPKVLLQQQRAERIVSWVNARQSANA